MRVDLRYLERIVAHTEQEEGSQTHLSVDALVQFSQGRLEGQEKEAVLAHLVHCEACRALLTTVPNLESKALSLRYRSRYRILGVAMAVAASLVLVVLLPIWQKERMALGMIDPVSIIEATDYKAPIDGIKGGQKIDADLLLQKIVSQTQMRDVAVYRKAVALEKQGDMRDAHNAYKQAYIAIRHTPDAKERLAQKIVIDYHLLLVARQDETKASETIKAYRTKLLYDIALYTIRYDRQEEH